MQNSYFISKATNIIRNNLDEESFGVSELAAQLGLSKSQLLRKIKSQTGLSSNLFIREVRLKESLPLLKNTDFTISEIAFKTGFSSPSYYNRCFREKYGITPGEYQSKDSDEITPTTSINKRFAINIKYLIPIAAFLIVAIAIFFRNKQVQVTKQSETPSIAVLPFLDLSENKDNEFLSLGLMDAVITELAKNKNLRVISRGSSMYFKDSSQLYPDIASKLGVEFLLEGSILHLEGKMRINVQLIDPHPQEKHIWANNYEEKSSDLLFTAQSISNQILNKIPGTSSELPKDLSTYKVNSLAFEYYLKGKYLWEKQNPASVQKSIEYLNQSINLDSTFAQAYVLLAECYISLNKLIPNQEEKLINRYESRKAIDQALNKALVLNETLASAYFTLANIRGKFDWDWDGMRLMAEKGLELEPYNPTGFMILSNYWTIKDDQEKAIEMAKIACKMDPINPRLGVLLAEKYEYAGYFKEAIAKYKEVIELFPDYGFAYHGIGVSYYLNGEKEKAREAWAKLQEIMGNFDMAEYFKDHNFDESVKQWLSEVRQGSKLYCSNPPIVAMAHVFGNREEGAIEYLKYGLEYKNEDLPIIINSPVFNIINNKSEFKNLTDILF